MTEPQKPMAAITVKVLKHLMPFLLLMYVLAFLDRVNLGFAKKAFQLDTGISDAAFAFGAGIFFIGYALCEVPSNLIMHKVGARAWMCRIMVTWGIVAAGMAVAHTEFSFYLLRVLLGIAEAGFFPGVILYMTYWIPAEDRGKAIGLFYFGAPLAFIIGSPITGGLLEFTDGLGGFRGWQWMFAIEGLLATLVGIWAFFYLDNRPVEAKWLTAEERLSLQGAIDGEETIKHSHGPKSVLAALGNGKVLYICLIYFMIQMSVYGVVFYLPTQVATLLGTNVGLEVGVVAAIPWICAIIAAYYIPRYSDRTGDRIYVAAATLAVGGLGIAVSAYAASPLIALIALCFGAAGFIAVQPMFWTYPTAYLAGAAAAGGIGLVNAIGTFGGFVAPNVKTWAEAAFQSNSAGLYFLGASSLVGAVLILGLTTLGVRGQVHSED